LSPASTGALSLLEFAGLEEGCCAYVTDRIKQAQITQMVLFKRFMTLPEESRVCTRPVNLDVTISAT
jgi:hypothetical protein